MSFRIHRYPDGREGLAAFCDTCREQITAETNFGYIVWNPDDVSDWRVVHTGRCDPGNDDRRRYSCSMPLDVEVVHLANSAGIDLDAARDHVATLWEIDS